MGTKIGKSLAADSKSLAFSGLSGTVGYPSGLPILPGGLERPKRLQLEQKCTAKPEAYPALPNNRCQTPTYCDSLIRRPLAEGGRPLLLGKAGIPYGCGPRLRRFQSTLNEVFETTTFFCVPRIRPLAEEFRLCPAS